MCGAEKRQGYHEFRLMRFVSYKLHGDVHRGCAADGSKKEQCRFGNTEYAALAASLS